MPYTITVSCPRCGRGYSYRSDERPLIGDCPLCWNTPDLTEAERRNQWNNGDITDEEAAIENDKDDS